MASSITSSSSLGDDLKIEVYALERLDNDLLRLRIGIKNDSNESFVLFDGLSSATDQGTAGAITLIDAENQQRYSSYKRIDGKCYCSAPLSGAIGSGTTAEMWVIYPEPPPEISSMTITTPLAPPILDVPLTESSDSADEAELANPEISDLTMLSDDTEDQTGRSENNDEVSIILSSDVLFETDSAELQQEAQEILEQVAREIDDAESSTVRVDGHADNTGSDSVNIPLSEERAESVESTLDEMITRSGVSFEVEGHGSSDPIADNSTEEGRERNRRVTVTFEK
ncbi:OmpA family protein [Nocardiopsis sp. NRRL B-16309]|uniref:OmpA family protein n=1 Tax=Nocardiopsis sp. NRRL B-16309 TaxID=1519494 RepID=UPI0018D1B2E4|nr:OmpA family protein [Nocardiopsis sp. NRRL B-16309]